MDSESREGEIAHNGRMFAPITAFTEAELAEIRSPDMFAKPDTVERTAMRLRLQMMHEGMHYIESELNYELAQEFFSDEHGPSNDESEPVGRAPLTAREGRSIQGTDDRAFAVNPKSIPSESVAMTEVGGSGALVGPKKLYTAAHEVYRNVAPVGQSCMTAGVCGWLCADLTAWTADDGCGNAGWPRWRFGMGSGTNQTNPVAETGWISGPSFIIPTAWTTGGGTTGFDRAAIDWAIGTFASAPGVGTHMGWVALSNAQISGKAVYNAGYPTRSNCPPGALGDNVDCAGGTLELGPTEFTRPYNWGELMWTAAGSAVAGSTSPSWSSGVDVTFGHSGGPLLLWWTGGCTAGCPDGWYVVGAFANHDSSTNRFNRLTAAHGSWL